MLQANINSHWYNCTTDWASLSLACLTNLEAIFSGNISIWCQIFTNKIFPENFASNQSANFSEFFSRNFPIFFFHRRRRRRRRRSASRPNFRPIFLGKAWIIKIYWSINYDVGVGGGGGGGGRFYASIGSDSLFPMSYPLLSCLSCVGGWRIGRSMIDIWRDSCVRPQTEGVKSFDQIRLNSSDRR